MSETRDDTPRHGGDLAFATARYGVPPEGWLDLSTGINPLPYPAADIAAASLARLPDRAALARLCQAARAAYGAPPSAALIAVPGSEIALRLLPHRAPPGPVAIVSPTYPSHADAWRHAGRTPATIGTREAVPADTAVVVLANPNNPDGHTTAPETLAALARSRAARGGLLIVDEAFADTAPEASLVPLLADAPALVLRSLGKFYGLPGLRLGFVVGVPAMIGVLERQLGDWPVSAPAIAIGTAALEDAAWRDRTRRQLQDRAARLRDLLARHRLAVVGGTDLFVLIDDTAAAEIHVDLARHGIWTRAFAERKTWLRFGLPPDDAALARLDTALSARR